MAVATPTDTLRLNIAEAESKFLAANYYLLAQKYNINTAEAATAQARLWNNPTFFFETVAFNPSTNKAFDYSNKVPNSAEYIVQINQIVSLAASRSKLVKLSETNTKLQKLAFSDLMRTLRRQLRSVFYDLDARYQKRALLRLETERLSALLEAQRIALQSGAVSGYEFTRLQVEVQSLQMSINDLNADIIDLSSQLKLLTGLPAATVPVPVSPALQVSAAPVFSAALDSALNNRPDYIAAKTQIIYQTQNLTYQRSLAVPRVTIGATFDKFGNAFNNYTGVNAAFDLPFINRNQGNIQGAQFGIEAAKAGSSFSELTVRNEVDAAFQRLQQSAALLQTINPQFRTAVQDISLNAVADYNKRLISLVDFIDKIRTYKAARLNETELQNSYRQAADNFNFVTNTAFFKP